MACDPSCVAESEESELRNVSKKQSDYIGSRATPETCRSAFSRPKRCIQASEEPSLLNAAVNVFGLKMLAF